MTLIDPVSLKTRLGALAGRFDVDALAECDSTSSELLRRAERGAPAGTVIVADRQHAGRGRRGRSWLSSPEGSLTFSLLWRFAGGATQLSGLSLGVGVALARALEGLGAVGVRLKWPNDVLLARDDGFSKLAGILIELSSDRRGVQIIIGIGLNLQEPATADLQQAAAGLSSAGVGLDRHEILAAILIELAGVLDRFGETGFASLRDAWQGYHAWQGLPVRILGDMQTQCGRCLGVDDDGSLLLETDKGLERIISGDVSLRPAEAASGTGFA